MTAAELEALFKAIEVASKDGAYSVQEGSSLTMHISHAGASLAFGRVETLRVEGQLVVARTPKSTIAFQLADLFAVTRDGSGPEGRRPAGFGA